MPNEKQADRVMMGERATLDKLQEREHVGSHSEPSKERGARAKLRLIKNVDDLIQAVYAERFKRTKFKKAELNAMRSCPYVGPRQATLVDLARQDELLDSTRQLLLIGLLVDAPVVAREICNFVRDVISAHPAFQSSLEAVGELQQPENQDGAVLAVASQDYDSLEWPEHRKHLSKADLKRCRTNAVQCLLLLMRISHRVSVDRIHRHLQSTLWGTAARQYPREDEQLAALVATRDPATAAVVYKLVRDQLVEQARQVDAASRREQAAVSRAADLEVRVAELAALVEDLRGEVGRLNADLMEAGEAHETDRHHWKDDYEKLRGRVLNRLAEEVSLLDEGLHALHRDPPKVRVMIDHADRAIQALKIEMDRLREDK